MARKPKLTTLKPTDPSGFARETAPVRPISPDEPDAESPEPTDVTSARATCIRGVPDFVDFSVFLASSAARPCRKSRATIGSRTTLLVPPQR